MSNALLPFAEHRLIAPGENDPRIIPVGNVFHVAVSEGRSLRRYFDGPSGGIESHGYIRRDGSVEQYRDHFHEADAQYHGNSWVHGGKRYGLLSWESQGMGPGDWTPEQLATIKRIMQWTHDNLPEVPMRVCPGPFSPGNGYHAMYREWNPNNHSCPGPDRIKQFHQILVPWMRAGGGGTEDEVSWNEKIDQWEPGDHNPDDTMKAGQQLNQARGFAKAAYDRTRRLEKALAALGDALGGKVSEAVSAALAEELPDALADAAVSVDVNVAGKPAG